MLRIHFDQDSCIGSGICESLVPDVFRTNDDGTTSVQTDTVAEARRDEVEQAVSRCPTGAIVIASEH
ncbi:ferredoxin [Mycolicibacterium vinylchloridicum]|uniref:ferredoxin n=1 Tax=Mycolicibacterium vinylchloridicum TaxID=2736928 RepID=UPI0015C6FC58